MEQFSLYFLFVRNKLCPVYQPRNGAVMQVCYTSCYWPSL